MRTRHFQSKFLKQTISLENLASKQKTFRIVKEQTRAVMRPRNSKHLFVAAGGGTRAGGANRDRTGDLLVANQTLSQLSYGPPMRLRCWWVWEELHPRPHPYQGCALTN